MLLYTAETNQWILGSPASYVAVLAKSYMAKHQEKSKFKGFQVSEVLFETSGFACEGCSNNCEVVEVKMDSQVLARWGSRCGKWELGEIEEAKASTLIS